MKTSRILSGLVIGLFAAGLGLSTGHAQTVDPDRADRALREAQVLEQQMQEKLVVSDRLEAARLHIESARARSADDPQAVASLRAAGNYIGSLRPSQASDLLSEAASRALAIGDLITAAHSYLDAAAVIAQSGKKSYTLSEAAQLERWITQAALLAESPLLDELDRGRILNRIDFGHFAG